MLLLFAVYFRYKQDTSGQSSLQLFLRFSISRQPKHLTADAQVTVVQLIHEPSQQHASFGQTQHAPARASDTAQREMVLPDTRPSGSPSPRVSAPAADTALLCTKQLLAQPKTLAYPPSPHQGSPSVREDMQAATTAAALYLQQW